MIEINLLPEGVKTSKKLSKEAFKIKYIINFIPIIIFVLIVVHIYLAVLNINNSYQLNNLNKKWASKEPQRKLLSQSREELALFSADAQAIQKISKHAVNWSEKLNKLSLYLPPGVWLNELTVRAKDFVIKGSVVSGQKEEMSLINRYLNSLKSDGDFFADFNNLEMGSAVKKAFGRYEIVEFVLTGTLKAK